MSWPREMQKIHTRLPRHRMKNHYSTPEAKDRGRERERVCVSGKLSWNSIWSSWHEKLICFVGNRKIFHQMVVDYASHHLRDARSTEHNASPACHNTIIVFCERIHSFSPFGIYTKLWQFMAVNLVDGVIASNATNWCRIIITVIIIAQKISFYVDWAK